jgi:hypothetical protein
MYGLTRGLMTLVGVAIAGGLIWLASWFGPRDSMSDYWIAMGLVAGAGLVIAISQLLGGWTKWGMPTVSPSVLLLGFLPALVAGGWIVIAAQPSTNEAGNRVAQWSSDIGIGGLVADMTPIVGAIAFGLGLVFGLVFDTTGPRRRDAVDERDAYAYDGRDVGRDRDRARTVGRDGRAADEPVAAERTRTYDDTGRTYDDGDTVVDRPERETAGVGARDERATPSAPQPDPEAQPRRRSFFRR